MFESAPVNPPDSIFGLTEEFRSDPNPNKINLTVGMYQDENGQTPVMDCVKRAKEIILETGESHVYLPIAGMNDYNKRIPELVLGTDHSASASQRAYSAQTPGGTAALRVAGEMLAKRFNVQNIWMSEPTWANHKNIFPAAGLNTRTYHYLDDHGTSIHIDRLLDSLKQAEHGDAVLLHTVCHNPTGVDPSEEQWQQIFDVVLSKKLIPIFDFAYQGFGESVDADAFPIREYCRQANDAVICSSFSKNFNLYGERVGAITVVGPNAEDGKAVLSQAKAIIRAMYSNPPTHGAAIVNTVLNDNELKQQWLKELDAIRSRINDLRVQFVAAISQQIPDLNFSHITNQRGMFSYSGISGDVVDRLKNEHSIYLLRSGRINIAGMNSNNMDRLCDAIASVLMVNS